MVKTLKGCFPFSYVHTDPLSLVNLALNLELRESQLVGKLIYLRYRFSNNVSFYFRMQQYHSKSFATSAASTAANINNFPPPKDYASTAAVKHQYTTDMFRQKYYTSFTSQIPVLGIQSPMTVNLNFTCGPDIVNTGIQYRYVSNRTVMLLGRFF